MELLNAKQKNFFETFGYLAFPGLLANELDWIRPEFEAVFKEAQVLHTKIKRTAITPFIDRRPNFCKLLDHPAILAIANGLLGEDFNYLSSDGNYYVGDTSWHSDGAHRVGKYLKLAFYLSPVKGDTGALRVIPGSHLLENSWEARQARNSREEWGIEEWEVPAVALASDPGDLLVFNHNLMHSSFFGNQERPMFTLNLSQRAVTREEIQDLDQHILHLMGDWTLDHMYAAPLWETASLDRGTHLKQIMDRVKNLKA